jgi:hypothetical protein
LDSRVWRTLRELHAEWNKRNPPVTFTLDPVFFAPVLAAVGAVDPPPFAGVVAALFIAPSQYAVYALIALAISSVFPWQYLLAQIVKKLLAVDAISLLHMHPS